MNTYQSVSILVSLRLLNLLLVYLRHKIILFTRFPTWMPLTFSADSPRLKTEIWKIENNSTQSDIDMGRARRKLEGTFVLISSSGFWVRSGIEIWVRKGLTSRLNISYIYLIFAFISR